MVRTTLVVGNQTLGRPGLIEGVQASAGVDGRVHVVVPATLLRRQDRQLAHSEGLAHDGETIHVAVARWRLQRALQDLERAGIDASGHVGPPDPLEAVLEAVQQVTPDAILISTHHRRASRWLAKDLPSRVRRAVDVPVVVVEDVVGT